MQCKDISTEEFLAALERDKEDHPYGAFWWTMAEREGWPEKVVLAKARRLLRNGVIDGCGCGCRGDFNPV